MTGVPTVDGVRLTPNAHAVLRVLVEAETDADPERYSTEVSKATGLAYGTAGPIMAKLEARGWAQSRYETGRTGHSGPPRRYYRLTAHGLRQARAVLGRVT